MAVIVSACFPVDTVASSQSHSTVPNAILPSFRRERATKVLLAPGNNAMLPGLGSSVLLSAASKESAIFPESKNIFLEMIVT